MKRVLHPPVQLCRAGKRNPPMKIPFGCRGIVGVVVRTAMDRVGYSWEPWLQRPHTPDPKSSLITLLAQCLDTHTNVWVAPLTVHSHGLIAASGELSGAARSGNSMVPAQPRNSLLVRVEQWPTVWVGEEVSSSEGVP